MNNVFRRCAMLATTILLVLGGTTGCGSNAETRWVTPPGDVKVVVYLVDDITMTHKQAIESALRTIPHAIGITFETREQAYQRFKELYKESPEMVEAVRPDDMSASFRFSLTNVSETEAESIMSDLRNLPGVKAVDVSG